MKKLLLLAGLLIGSMGSYANPFVQDIAALEQRISGRIGVAVYDSQTDQLRHYRGDERFPLMSTATPLICATLLHEMDQGSIARDMMLSVSKNQIVMGSPIMLRQVGNLVRVEHACEAAMLTSDNTATNLAMQSVGGPVAVNQFLQAVGDDVTRVDRPEPKLSDARPNDVHNTTTPNTMLSTLKTLLTEDALSYESQIQLKIWMQDSQASDPLLRSALPDRWSVADHSGAGGFGSRGLVAMLWDDNHLPVFVAIYLTETDLSLQARDQVIVEISHMILRSLN
ncbi:class A beta-lactamase [Vibrio sp. CAU 1672]|uniref:class A beta-lactamase n=1 Tax=Vibrio sp. CAU 1672 TaxID=3032594 RepID=UPI0023D98A49|nr:class A beta-lactamase [Vibrio sp. CAU 1672]MDF2152917.1 class A beta-lactamase [Vibrio sp. CAU 1672]